MRQLVAACHDAGIEVLLDVVYNHTTEGNRHGPTLSWRGCADDVYYHQNDVGDYQDVPAAATRSLPMRRSARTILESMRWLGLELGWMASASIWASPEPRRPTRVPQRSAPVRGDGGRPAAERPQIGE